MAEIQNQEQKAVHSMKVACRRSGLSPHVLRVWEKRYQAVDPVRSATNRRGYTDGDIARLQLLGELTRYGHRIGQIARLSKEDLERLLEQDQSIPGGTTEDLDEPTEVVDRAYQAVKDLDADGLFKLMEGGLLKFGLNGVLQHVVGPLVVKVGRAWTEGDLRIAQEHLASRVLRDFLADATRTLVVRAAAPEILVATPAHQMHELGAMMVAAAAQNHGWRALYLGPSLPAVEIAGAATRRPNVRAVALSIVYPEDDANVVEELRTLGRHLPDRVSLLVGGRAVASYQEVVDEIGARTLGSLNDLFLALNELESAKSDHARG